MDHEVFELVRENVAVRGAREVTPLEAGAGDGAYHSVDHLLDA